MPEAITLKSLKLSVNHIWAEIESKNRFEVSIWHPQLSVATIKLAALWGSITGIYEIKIIWNWEMIFAICTLKWFSNSSFLQMKLKLESISKPEGNGPLYLDFGLQSAIAPIRLRTWIGVLKIARYLHAGLLAGLLAGSEVLGAFISHWYLLSEQLRLSTETLNLRSLAD